MAVLCVKFATCCFNPYEEDGSLRKMSYCRRLLLAPIAVMCRIVLFAMGYIWITEEFPAGSGACCGCGTYFPDDFNAVTDVLHAGSCGNGATAPSASSSPISTISATAGRPAWASERRGCEFVGDCRCPYSSCCDCMCEPCDGLCMCGYLRRRDIPRIVTPNHVTFVDSLYIASQGIPTFVMQADLVGFPLVGSALAGLQPILVPRTKEQKQRLPNPKKALTNRVTAPDVMDFPPLLIFPEGTATTYDTVLAFQMGAFLPGRPVQPLALSYPNCHNDVSWTADVSPLWLALRMFTSCYNRLHVNYLEPYVPSAEEVAAPAVFAANVRNEVAEALGAAATDYTDKDSVLIGDVMSKYGLGNYTLVNILSGLNTRMASFAVKQHYRELSGLVKRFRDADSNSDGKITLDEFKLVMSASAGGQLDSDSDEEDDNLGKRLSIRHRSLDQLFALMDQDGDGELNYREIILGIATALGRAEEVAAAYPEDMPQGSRGSGRHLGDAGAAGDETTQVSGLLLPPGVKAQLEIAFAVYDSNGDGFVTVTELVRVMLQLQLAANAAAVSKEAAVAAASTATRSRRRRGSKRGVQAPPVQAIPGSSLSGTPLTSQQRKEAELLLQQQMTDLMQNIDWGSSRPTLPDGGDWHDGMHALGARMNFEQFVRLALHVKPLVPRTPTPGAAAASPGSDSSGAAFGQEAAGAAAATEPIPIAARSGVPTVDTGLPEHRPLAGRSDSMADAWGLVVGAAVKTLHGDVGLAVPATPRLPENMRSVQRADDAGREQVRSATYESIAEVQAEGDASPDADMGGLDGPDVSGMMSSDAVEMAMQASSMQRRESSDSGDGKK